MKNNLLIPLIVLVLGTGCLSLSINSFHTNAFQSHVIFDSANPVHLDSHHSRVDFVSELSQERFEAEYDSGAYRDHIADSSYNAVSVATANSGPTRLGTQIDDYPSWLGTSEGLALLCLVVLFTLLVKTVYDDWVYEFDSIKKTNTHKNFYHSSVGFGFHHRLSRHKST